MLERLAELVGHLDKRCFTFDPIAALDAMVESDAFGCCPLVYGYVSYTQVGFRPRRLAFADIPCLGSSGPLGSVLGGTGLAVSSRSRHTAAALCFAYWITSAEVQRGLYVGSGGQAGHAAAWLDSAVEAAANGFYSGTRATLEGTLLRPRYDGYMAFQDTASHIVANGLAEGSSARRILARLNEATTHKSLQKAAESCL